MLIEKNGCVFFAEGENLERFLADGWVEKTQPEAVKEDKPAPAKKKTPRKTVKK